FFFFSSRRRHTRSKRDWSSDVCSSDLKIFACIGKFAVLRGLQALLISSSGIFGCFVGSGAQGHALNLCSSLHHDSAHVNAAAESNEIPHKVHDTGVKTRSRGSQLTIRQLASWNSHIGVLPSRARLQTRVAAGVNERISPRSQLHAEIAVRRCIQLLTHP